MKMLNRTLLAILLAVAGVSLAHEQKAVVTTIAANPRTNLLEVVHRFSLHDVEHAVRDLHWPATDMLASKRDQAHFARFVASQFKLEISDAKTVEVPLTLVGQELEGRYLWVYQECPQPQDFSKLLVSSTVLRDVWPAHQHLVNITVNDTLRSLVFTEGISRLPLAPLEQVSEFTQ